MKSREPVILKFGSSVLPDEDALPAAVQVIHDHVEGGWRVVAVVSAFADVTRLLRRRVAAAGVPLEDQASHIATGEARVAALLGRALERAGIRSTLLAPPDIGLRTEGPVLDSLPVSIDRPVLERALEERPVAVIPGFVGVAPNGATSLLGTGGSDLTAIYLAHALGTQTCRLIKDVQGVFERDPALPGPAPRRFSRLSWEDALGIAGKIIQNKALRCAGEWQQPFEVTSLTGIRSTLVGPGPSRLAEADQT